MKCRACRKRKLSQTGERIRGTCNGCDLFAGSLAVLNQKAGWPIESIALQVDPSQVEEFQNESRRLGVPTEYTSEGRPILRNAAHARAYRKSQGFFDRDGFFD